MCYDLWCVFCTCSYLRTQESLSHAGQVTSSALSTMGMVITRRLAEMRYKHEILSSRLLIPIKTQNIVALADRDCLLINHYETKKQGFQFQQLIFLTSLEQNLIFVEKYI